VKVDNIGEICLAKNSTSGERITCIDITYHYVGEMVDEGLIEIEFVKPDESTEDLFTKTLCSELCTYHSVN
jgi:hypothetical protein